MKDMLNEAKSAQKKAYAPYSRFHVGCCIKTKNQTLYSGCNVENASYGLTQCAEGSAISIMIAAGEQDIDEVLVITEGELVTAPCGACRQKINEFGTPQTKVHLCNAHGWQKTMTMDELLPLAFGPKNLE